ncbi:hypothetical protein ACTHPF_17360 [Paenibacillus sp. SAF-054]|uniref:hypothetical protein n=1 Tax=unclassified Paenibacillus TaxID=185978 RepID=UPI003F7F1AC4
MPTSTRFEHYKPAMLRLPPKGELTRNDLLTDAFRMAVEGRTEMYYAPHNDWANDHARVAIIGITPGWTQMKLAYQAARAGFAEGLTDDEICRLAKRKAGFAGPMRRNLIAMLDQLGLAECLNLHSSAALFEEQGGLLHTTSLLKYPVFVQGRNYGGSSPDMLASPLLRREAAASAEKLLTLPDALLIPLGRAVERILSRMAEQGQMQEERILRGFPHPSGANGHRHRQFLEQQEGMKKTMQTFFRQHAHDRRSMAKES